MYIVVWYLPFDKLVIESTQNDINFFFSKYDLLILF